jgi:hypothetical protein
MSRLGPQAASRDYGLSQKIGQFERAERIVDMEQSEIKLSTEILES